MPPIRISPRTKNVYTVGEHRIQRETDEAIIEASEHKLETPRERPRFSHVRITQPDGTVEVRTAYKLLGRKKSQFAWETNLNMASSKKLPRLTAKANRPS